MIRLQVLCDWLQNLLDVPNLKDYCPNGLQVEGKDKIEKVAFAVSAGLSVLEKAASVKADALIVHHGVFWKDGSQVITGVQKRKLEVLLKSQMSLFGYHLPLDLHRAIGNNWKAAKDLGWDSLEPCGIYNDVAIGVKGTFKSMTVDAFCGKLERYYGHKATKVLGGKKKVTSAAIVSGGAHMMLGQIAKSGVDCFVTGSFDEPAWYGAEEEKINFFSLGHNATEKVGVKALLSLLEKEKLCKTVFIESENPF